MSCKCSIMISCNISAGECCTGCATRSPPLSNPSQGSAADIVCLISSSRCECGHCTALQLTLLWRGVLTSTVAWLVRSTWRVAIAAASCTGRRLRRGGAGRGCSTWRGATAVTSCTGRGCRRGSRPDTTWISSASLNTTRTLNISYSSVSKIVSSFSGWYFFFSLLTFWRIVLPRLNLVSVVCVVSGICFVIKHPMIACQLLLPLLPRPPHQSVCVIHNESLSNKYNTIYLLLVYC